MALYANDLENPQHLIDLQGEYNIVATDDDNERLLLVETDLINKISNFVVYNIISGEIEKRGMVLSGDYAVYGWSYSVTSLDKRFTAIPSSTSQNSGAVVNLLIWDWETSEFVDYGPIHKLIGWDEEKHGILVLEKEEASDGNYFPMKWVQPKDFH